MYSRDEIKQLKRDFWNGFDEYVSQRPEMQGRRKKFLMYNTRLKGAEMKFDATRDGAYVILEFNHRSKSERERLFEHFKRYKVIVDQYITDLTWDNKYTRESGEEVCRIYKAQHGLDLHRREQWPQFYEFMADNMIQLEAAFLDVKDSLPEPGSF